MRAHLFPFLLVFALACNGPGEDAKDNQPTGKIAYAGTGKLTPISATDSNYKDLASVIKESTTPSGWDINYFFKDDSTRYQDLYIGWSKGSRKGFYRQRGGIGAGKTNIPQYAGENDLGIFFTHGCGAGCKGLLVLSKDTMNGYNDYMHVVDFNPALGQILYVTNNTYQNAANLFELGLIDLNRKKQHTIAYKGIAGVADIEGVVKKTSFASNKITITTNLQKSPTDTTRQTEMRTVLLDR